MEAAYPESWADLTAPWTRAELILSLKALAVVDPRAIWIEERQRGLVSGIDEVFHFFFDDHEFDENEVGSCLFNQAEIFQMRELKKRLAQILDDLPNGDDDAFVKHPLWPMVTQSAVVALASLEGR